MSAERNNRPADPVKVAQVGVRHSIGWAARILGLSPGAPQVRAWWALRPLRWRQVVETLTREEQQKLLDADTLLSATTSNADLGVQMDAVKQNLMTLTGFRFTTNAPDMLDDITVLTDCAAALSRLSAEMTARRDALMIKAQEDGESVRAIVNAANVSNAWFYKVRAAKKATET